MNNKIISQIKALPPLPKSVIEIQKITSDPNSSIADLIKVVKEDPMLTANLLKAANSPLYGFTRQIKSVDQAVSLFGMATVKGFAISFAIRNSLKFDLEAYGISEQQFHDISMYRNSVAIEWYKRERSRLDILATDSFLIDIGAVVIALILKEEGLEERFKTRLQNEDRYFLEKEFVGADTTEITVEIFKHWNFSEDLVEAMANINNPKEPYKVESASLLVLREAIDLVKSISKESIQKALEIAKKYNLNVAILEEVLNKKG